MYPKNEGIFIPELSAILLTMKLGPFPIYVLAPMKTAPRLIGTRYCSAIYLAPPSERMVPVSWGRAAAVSKNTT